MSEKHARLVGGPLDGDVKIVQRLLPVLKLYDRDDFSGHAKSVETYRFVCHRGDGSGEYRWEGSEKLK